MKTPDEIKIAHQALEEFYKLVVEWRKATLITFMTVYYDGHPSKDTRDPDLVKALKAQVINFYREAVFEQLKLLEKQGINTSTLLPEDLT